MLWGCWKIKTFVYSDVLSTTMILEKKRHDWKVTNFNIVIDQFFKTYYLWLHHGGWGVLLQIWFYKKFNRVNSSSFVSRVCIKTEREGRGLCVNFLYAKTRTVKPNKSEKLTTTVSFYNSCTFVIKLKLCFYVFLHWVLKGESPISTNKDPSEYTKWFLAFFHRKMPPPGTISANLLYGNN